MGKVDNVGLINSYLLSSGDNGSGLNWESETETEDILVRFRYISPSFFETVGIELLEGHGFNMSMASDSTNTIITKSFAQLMGEGSPIGKTIHRYGTTYNVVGVVNDFRYGDLYSNDKTGPVMFFNNPEFGRRLYIKTKSGIAMNEVLANVEDVMKKHNPAFPFEFRFENDLFNARFKNEELVGRLSQIFAVLAICIACLGLFGLAAFTAEQRKKEIGVRKVLGANIGTIVAVAFRGFYETYTDCPRSCLSFGLLFHVQLAPRFWLSYSYRLDPYLLSRELCLYLSHCLP